MPRIDPTPGRVVYFWPTKRDCPGEWPGDGVPLAATIAFVHANGRIVNLTVHEASGIITAKRLVRLVQDDEKPVEGESFCSWMPYQLGQARQQSAPEALKQVTRDVGMVAVLPGGMAASPGTATQTESQPPANGDNPNGQSEGRQEGQQGQQG